MNFGEIPEARREIFFNESLKKFLKVIETTSVAISRGTPEENPREISNRNSWENLVLPSLGSGYIVRITKFNLQHYRAVTINLCKLMPNGTEQVAVVQESYLRQGHFYLENLVNPVFDIFSKNKMINSCVMP